MTAIAVRDMRPPRRPGMKILAATLTLVCTVQLLLAFEEARTVALVRAAQAGVPAERAGDWLGQTWAGLVRAADVSPPVVADPEDRLLRGSFTPADESTLAQVSTVAFEGADVVVDDDQRLETRPLRIAAGSDALDRLQTFATVLNAAADAQIELREVLAAGDAPGSCGGRAPAVLALLHRGQSVDVLLLRAAPGADAAADVVCSRWALKA